MDERMTMFPAEVMRLEDVHALLLSPRDLTAPEFIALCRYCCNTPIFYNDKRCFRETTDPLKMCATINGTSISEARRRNVTASPEFTAGLWDVRWGCIRAGKKDLDIYIINPLEEWEKTV